MKKFQIVCWLIFFLGLIAKFFHIPGSALMLIVGTIAIFICAVIHFAKHVRVNPASALLQLAFAGWTIYFLFRIQYWPGLILLFAGLALLTLTWLIVHFAKRQRFGLPEFLLVIYIVFCIAIGFTRTYRIYYFFNYTILTSDKPMPNSPYTWDKYSWFLYLAGKQEEALDANKNAIDAVDRLQATAPDASASPYLVFLRGHGEKIRSRTWTSFP